MKMPSHTLIQIDAWATGVHLLIGGDDKGVQAWQRRYLKGYDCSNPDTKGDEGYYDHVRNSKTGHAAHVLWIKRQPKSPEGIGTVAHEATHAAIGILRNKGIRLSNASEESYAYLVDFLVTKTLEVLNKKKLWAR